MTVQGIYKKRILRFLGVQNIFKIFEYKEKSMYYFCYKCMFYFKSFINMCLLLLAGT